MNDYRQHPDHLAFLKAILANPDDDAPRLVYADWLDEIDQPERAEFIRRQIAHKNCSLTLNGIGGVVDVSAFRNVNSSILRERLGFDRLKGAEEATLRRGFISALKCTLPNWMLYGPAIVATHPVESLWLTDGMLVKELGSKRCWYSISSMDFNDRLFQARADSPNERHWLPKEFADYVDRGRTVRKTFDSIQEAHEWLSRQAIMWAKLAKPQPEFTIYRPEVGEHL
jgi:uncharacterized protein (TIGR02996 family)